MNDWLFYGTGIRVDMNRFRLFDDDPPPRPAGDVYYRDGSFFCFVEYYGDLMIMGGPCRYFQDSRTTFLLSIMERSELKNFIKIDHTNLDQYDYITKDPDVKVYKAKYHVELRKYDYILGDGWCNKLKDNYKYYLRSAKIKRVLNGR